MGNASNEIDATAIVAAKPRRRWLRYSLRSLLVLTALVAVCVGWLFPSYERARVQREIASNSDYQYLRYEEGFDPATDSSPVPGWLSGILDHHYFCDVVEIGQVRASDENLARLKGLPKLQSIRVGVGHGATFEDLGCLLSVPKLRSVYINEHFPYGEAPMEETDVAEDLPGLGTLKQIENLAVSVPINDKSAKEIVQLTNLRKLTLQSTVDVNEANIQTLGNLTALQSLEVPLHDSDVEENVDQGKSSRVVSASDQHFLGKLKQLRSLSIRGKAAISGKVLSSLQELPNLKSLEIHVPAQLTPEVVKRLEKLTTLQSLILNCWRLPGYDTRYPIPQGYEEPPEEPLTVSEADLVKLVNALNLKHFKFSLHDTQNGSDLDKFTNLEHLHIKGNQRTKAAVPLRLSLSKNLQVLEFEYLDSLSDADLAKIAQHPGLKTLNLQYCYGITVAGIAMLANLKTLTHLKVDHCEKVTPAAVKSLQAAIPKLQIEFSPY